MHLGRRWFTVVLGAASIGIVVWLATSENGLDTGDKVASIAAALIGLITLFLTLRPHTTTASRDPDQALEDLARLVTRQWERFTHQASLDVRWASTERPVAPSAAEVVGTTTTAAKPTRLKLHGDVDELADALQKLPGHQLVLLGEPGSGKTSAAAVLMLRLLDRRKTGDAVPVLLSLASWDPKTQDLETWMTQRISIDHPTFRKRGVHGQEAARDLVERGMVLPVLDALDEVASKIEAVRGIAQVVGRTKPMVLTCRTDDYEEIIRETGVPVGRAAVVELKPVSSAEAARYLEAGTPDNERRWQPVAAALHQEPGGVLARALSTPLAVYLAKTAYTSPSTDPADLLALPTSTAVEHHLLDSYLPALYPAPDDARKWLAFLARRLAASPAAGNLAWWRLFLLLPKPHVITSATRAALVGAVFMLGVVIRSFATGQVELPANARHLTAWILLMLVFLLTGAVAATPLGALAGCAVTALAARRPQAERAAVPLPKNLVLTWRNTVRVTASQTGMSLLLTLLLGTFSWPEIPLDRLLIIGLLLGLGASVSSLAASIAVDAPIDVRSALAGDRNATLVKTPLIATVLAVMVMMLASSSLEPMTADTIASIIVVTAVFVCWWQFSGAWVRFGIARLWFALFRKLPWRLMQFLDDAHQRGVLRQVGAAYEFRHQRLQHYFSRQENGAP